MKKTTIIIVLVMLLIKFTGFLRDIILSYYYGASAISDIYIISLTIPGVIFAFIGVAIKTGYIPLFQDVLENKGLNHAIHFTNNLVYILLLITTFILIVCIIFMENIIKVFASGFDDNSIDIAVTFSRITILGVLFTSITYIFSGFLQSRGKYVVTAFIGLPLNIIFILSIILSAHLSIMLLPIGVVVAYLVQVLFLGIFIKKERFKLFTKINLTDKYLKKLLILALPVVLGSSLNQLNILVDRTLASRIEVGGISALNYADKLNLFVQGLAVTSIVTLFLPIMSQYFIKKNYTDFRRLIEKSLIFLSLIIVPSTLVFISFSQEIITFLFGRGQFDDNAIYITSSVLLFYSFGMLGVGVREILAQSFYAMQNTKIPMINGAIGLIINILLNLILSQFMGLNGLALATSISSIITAFLMYLSLKKHIGVFINRDGLVAFIKIFVAAVIMIIILNYVYGFLHPLTSINISFSLIVILGIIIYFVFLYLFKIKEVSETFHLLKSKILNKN